MFLRRNLGIVCCIVLFPLGGRSDDQPRGNVHGENSVAFAPDGKWLVTGGSDGRVRIRDGNSGAIIATLVGHDLDVDVNAVAVSPDGRTIASASNDLSARLWDVATRTERRVLLTPRTRDGELRYCVLSVAFASDGKTVATGDNGGFLRLWDVESGHLKESWPADAQKVEHVLYSPDGSTIASAGAEVAVKLWDARSHRLRRSLSQPGKSSPHMAFAPDGVTLAISRDENITFWDTATGRETDHLNVKPELAPALAYTPDGAYLVTGGNASTRLCAAKPTIQASDRCSMLVYSPEINHCSALAVSPDGRWVAHSFYHRYPSNKANFKLVAIR